MAYSIEWANAAAKELESLDESLRLRVSSRVDRLPGDLSHSPWRGIRRVQGRCKLYRAREGVHRIIFAVEQEDMIVILRVRHRSKAYRGL